jgi:hypothetical protein
VRGSGGEGVVEREWWRGSGGEGVVEREWWRGSVWAGRETRKRRETWRVEIDSRKRFNRVRTRWFMVMRSEGWSMNVLSSSQMEPRLSHWVTLLILRCSARGRARILEKESMYWSIEC